MKILSLWLLFSTLSFVVDAFAPLSSNTQTSSSALNGWRETATAAAAALTLLTTTTAAPVIANAAESSRVIGEIKGSGLVFKDTLQIESFPDPKVQGVTLYISNFQKPITERLGSGMFSDPSSASVACAQTSPTVQIADNIDKSKGGEQVFSESKSILFKSLRVQRIYDQDTQTMVYVTFNTRLDKSDDANKSRFASGLCAVNLQTTTPEATAKE